MTSSSLIEQKFGSTGPHPLGRAEWRRLQAYLAIERGAALLYEGKRLRGLGYILASLWHKPRLQPAVEAFWERSDVVPDDVMKTHHEMLRQSR